MKAAKGKSIAANVKQSLTRVRRAPATKGTGLITKKGTT